MPYGLMTWDENGVVQIEPQVMLGKILQVIDTNKENGSYSDARASGQRAWAAVINPSSITSEIHWFARFGRPSVSFDGTTISWSYSSPNINARAAVRIYYGVH